MPSDASHHTPAVPLSDDAPNWFDRLTAHGALFAVDAEQRVTRWSASCSPLLGEADRALGRHCYEVLASLDPRNGSRCRPNCAVMVAARRGLPLPDFEVWLPAEAGGPSAQVSILLSGDGAGRVTEVLHLVRESAPNHRRNKPDDSSTGGLRSVLAVVAGRPSEASPQMSALSARQREVLAGLAVGESADAIAARLGITRITVRNHLQAAMARLGAHRRLDAVLTAVTNGLV